MAAPDPKRKRGYRAATKYLGMSRSHLLYIISNGRKAGSTRSPSFWTPHRCYITMKDVKRFWQQAHKSIAL
jgi:hypothetical protein